MFLLVLLVCVQATFAQQSPKCAFDKTIQSVIATNPSFANTYEEVRSGERYTQQSAAKTSASIEAPVIPVVFHIILTAAQSARLKDSIGIQQRVESQMAVLNRDFNARNEDSIKIPGGFKDLFGNAGISFGLAHTAPDGSATPGYEIITTTAPGFDLEGGYGSGFGFSGAKHTAGGGADAWDTDTYLNIWIVNPLDAGDITNILGLAIPTYIANDNNGIDPEERGIVLHYGAFGNRSTLFDYYVKNSDGGRTLTHEVGHYFNLLHIWGDDDGKCPGTGGFDDGIADTPPQQYSSSNCNTYPKYDACSKSGDGIMFMNYMDYSVDDCMQMFTHEQVAKMKGTIQPGADVYPLTQHPWVLLYPDVVQPDNSFTVYPNPTNGRLNIAFYKKPTGLRGIYITDMAGRVVATQEYDRQTTFYSFSTSGLHTGIYLLVLDFEGGKEVSKVLVQ